MRSEAICACCRESALCKPSNSYSLVGDDGGGRGPIACTHAHSAPEQGIQLMTLLDVVEFLGISFAALLVSILASMVQPRKRATLCLAAPRSAACSGCARLATCRPLAAAAALMFVLLFTACGDPGGATSSTSQDLTACSCFSEATRTFVPNDCMPPDGAGPNGEPGVAWMRYCNVTERPDPPIRKVKPPYLLP